MIELKNLNLFFSKIVDGGPDEFLRKHSVFESSDIDGIYHYRSLLPDFEKFIFFDLKTKKISLIFSKKNIYFSDICRNFTILSSNYSFRDDLSRVRISNSAYISINGRPDSETAPSFFTDAKGNINYLDQILVPAIVVELLKN